MTNTITHPTGVIADHITAVNAFDTEAIMATFADDALVNDAHREFWGADLIRAWVAKEMVGDHVTLDPVEVLEHHGMTIVRRATTATIPRTICPIH
jgi:ketosteroid isomerase-like protein